MVNRTQQILLQLVKADGPLTSEDIGRRIGVCGRTVRSEIPEISRELAAGGAKLTARRNYGYRIEVCDESRYRDFCQQLGIKSMQIAAASYDEATRMLFVCRRIIGSSEGVRVDELADELSLTRSALREPLRRATAFFSSYGLKMRSVPIHGLQIAGDEYRVRLAATELCAAHFHKALLGDIDGGFASLVCCDEDERQAIRHTYLAVQRESGWVLRDSMTQRVAMYLVIARNRIRKGHQVFVARDEFDVLRSSPLFEVAFEVLSALAERFEGFRVSEEETAALALLLLCNLDLNSESDVHRPLPLVLGDLKHVRDRALSTTCASLGLDLVLSQRVAPAIDRVLAPMLIDHHFGLDGQMRFLHENEATSLESPVAVLCACRTVQALRDIAGLVPSEDAVGSLASVVASALGDVPYPVRPLRILVTDARGVECARHKGEQLINRFPDLVASMRACELYEIRGYDERDYDAVLTDSLPVSYNYSYPMAHLRLNRGSRDYACVHDKVLLNAYQLHGLLPEASALSVVRGFRAGSREQFVQLLALEHERDSSLRLAMSERLLRDGDAYGLWARAGVGAVADSCASGQEERIEIFELERPVVWSGSRLAHLVFLRLCLSGDACRVRARERLAAQLVEELAHSGHSCDDFLAKAEASPAVFFEELLRSSLRLS